MGLVKLGNLAVTFWQLSIIEIVTVDQKCFNKAFYSLISKLLK